MPVSKKHWDKTFSEWVEYKAKKAKAYSAVLKAKSKGEIVPPDRCSRCDAVCRVEGHHEDYDRPLDLTWLCTSCHARRHNEMRGRHESELEVLLHQLAGRIAV